MQRESVNDLFSLPPGAPSSLPLTHSLKLQIAKIVLQGLPARPISMQLHLWGKNNSFTILEQAPIVFGVRVSAGKFRDYLTDMRMSVVHVSDRRNGEIIGNGSINWLLLVRQGGQKVVVSKGFPFYDQNFEFNVPIFNHKKKQVAQIEFRVSFKQTGNLQDQQTHLIYGNSATKKQPILNNLMDEVKETTNLHQKSTSAFRNNNSSHQQSPQTQKFSANKLDFKDGQSQQILKASKGQKRLTTQKEQGFEGLEGSNRIRYPDCNYEIEKAKLKLQAEQFLSLTRTEQYSPETKNSSHNLIAVQVSDFIPMKSNAIVEYFDLIVQSKKEKQVLQNETKNKKHVRLFPNGKNTNNFSGEIIISLDDVLFIETNNCLGKATVEAKTINQKNLLKIYLNGKSSKFGAINIKKIYDRVEIEGKNIVSNNQTKIGPALVSPKNTSKQQIDKKLPELIQSFLLVIIKESKHEGVHDHLLAIKNYSFPRPFPSLNILPLNEFGSIFAFEFRNLKNETFDSKLVKQFAEVPLNQQSLGCTVLFNGWMTSQNGNGFLLVQILKGSIKQINYELLKLPTDYRNKKTQVQGNAQERLKTKTQTNINIDENSRSDRQMISQRRKQLFENTQRESSSNNYHMKQQTKQFNNKKQEWNRKVYTQVNPRIGTEPISQSKYQNKEMTESSLEGDIFLLQILSKFLHALPPDAFSETSPSSSQEFQLLLEHLMGSKQEREFISVVLDMFIDDISIQEGHPPKLDYEQFLKCIKGYHNFVQLYWKMKVDLANKIVDGDLEYEDKLKKYAEFGLIGKQVLWRKVFPKVNSPQRQLQFDRLFGLSQGGPISVQLLIEELKHIFNFPEELPKITTPQLILSLSRIVKQTVQSILQGTQCAINIAEDRVNIRGLCDLMNQLGISLSYWESLVIIEQLKGWYGLDLDLNEGIISGGTVEGWLAAIANRSVVLSNSKRSFTEQNKMKEQSLGNGLSNSIKMIKEKTIFDVKQETEKKQEIVKLDKNKEVELIDQNLEANEKKKVQLSKNASQANRLVENKSVVRSQLNEQQIFNIANLLRQNDGFQPAPVSSKPNSKVYGKDVGGLSMPMTEVHRILNDDMLDISSRDESSNENILFYQKKQNEIKQKPKPKFLYVKIKSLKLKDSSFVPSKLMMKVFNDEENYFFCMEQNETQNREFFQELPQDWNRKSKGLEIQFFKIIKNELLIEIEQTFFMYGILLSDEICELSEQLSKNKTVVLYCGKEIVGKISLEVTMKKQQPQIYYADKKLPIFIEIRPQSKYESQWCAFQIQTANFLLPKMEKNDKKVEIEKCRRSEIMVDGTFYKQVLLVSIKEVGQCTVPLQQLYFRNELVGQFPVINSGGQFIGNIQIKLQNPKKLSEVSSKTMTQNVRKSQLTQWPLAPQKFLIIFDSLSSFVSQAHQSISILGHIIVKDAFDRTVINRTSFLLEHQHHKEENFACTWLYEYQSNFCIVEFTQEQTVTFEIQYSGRNVAIGQLGINLADSSRKSCRVSYSLTHAQGLRPVELSLGLRLVKVPSSFQSLSPSRIFSALSSNRGCFSNGQKGWPLSLMEESQKLTISEQRLLKQLIESNKGIFYEVVQLSLNCQIKIIVRICQVDSQQTGLIEYENVQNILNDVIGEVSCKHLIHLFFKSFAITTNQKATMPINCLSFLEFCTSKKYNEVLGSEMHEKDSVSKQVDEIHDQIQRKYLRI